MSYMELADERDERYFAREAEKEEARAVRRGGRTSPPARSAPANRPSTASVDNARSAAKNLTLGEVAQRLRVSVAVVRAAHRAQNEASTGLGGLARREKLLLAARRLGITAEELRLPRRALAGNADVLNSPERIASLVRTTARAKTTESIPAPQPVTPDRVISSPSALAVRVRVAGLITSNQ